MENGGRFHSQPVPTWTLSSCVSCEALRMFGRSAGEDQQGDQRPVPVGQHGLFSGCHVCHVSQQRHLRSNTPTPPKSPPAPSVICILFFLTSIPLPRCSSEPSSDSELLCPGPSVLGQTGAVLPLPVAGGLPCVGPCLPGVLR